MCVGLMYDEYFCCYCANCRLGNVCRFQIINLSHFLHFYSSYATALLLAANLEFINRKRVYQIGEYLIHPFLLFLFVIESII